MAREPWDNWPVEEYSLYSEVEESLGRASEDDPHLAFLYHEALFDFDISPEFRSEVYGALVEYVDQEYGLDFDEIFDWDSYREYYDSR